MNLVNPVQVVKISNNFQGGFCYCVDEYGRQTEQEVDELDVGELAFGRRRGVPLYLLLLLLPDLD